MSDNSVIDELVNDCGYTREQAEAIIDMTAILEVAKLQEI